MRPAAHILHQTSGRTRFKVPEKRGDEDYFAQSREQLSELSGIEAVKTNPLTASILLLHPDTAYGRIETQLNQTELFELNEEVVAESTRSPWTSIMEEIEGSVREWSWDRHTALFVFFTVLGVRQLLRGEILAPAIPMFIYALEFALKKGQANQPPNP